MQLPDAVLEKGEVFELAKVLQSLDLIDLIEAQVEPFELDEGLKALNLRDDVVI